MNPRILLTLACLAAAGSAVRADDVPDGFAARIWTITDVVLDHHVNPPTRQQMILNGLQAVYASVGVPVPSGLARKVSRTTSVEQLAALLDLDVRPKAASNERPESIRPRFAEVFTQGMLASIPGGSQILTAKELKVQQQFAGNHYIGLQIALGFNKEAKRPELQEAFEGGPAHQAGVLKGDLIEEVDGVKTEGMELREVVDRLRGEEGSSVTIRVRSGPSADPRTYKASAAPRRVRSSQG